MFGVFSRAAGIITDLKQAIKTQAPSHPPDTLPSAHRNYEDECERGQMDTQGPVCACSTSVHH